MQIKLLDCTLRDGGYVNNWEFGEQAISDIKENLELSGADIIELGFIKNEPENKDRTVFNNMSDVKKIIGKNVPNRQYAVMAEVINPLPLDMLEPYKDGFPEIIRVIVWKRMLEEGFEYCKGIVEKGYKLCVQPARTNQYSDEEFINMIKKFNELNPMAFYVVDSWGTMYKNELLHYMKLADENLKEGISIGYHGHNNMMQTFDAAAAFCDQNTKRDVIIDASVYGIGRGAGNLNTEIFAKYLNEKCGGKYNIKPLLRVFDEYILDIYKKEKWGYSLPYFISAKYNANPAFANYYEKKGVRCKIIEKCIKSMEPEKRVIFSDKLALDTLYEARKSSCKFCIAVPTNNRSNVVKHWIENVAEELYEYGVDLIFFDSSVDDDAKCIVEKCGLKNVFYEKYDAKQIYPNDLDEKVSYCLKAAAEKYDIIWPCRDRSLPLISNIYEQVIDFYNKREDFIIVYPHYKNKEDFKLEFYNNPKTIAYKYFGEMTSLGSIIYTSQFAKRLHANQQVQKNVNLGLWGPVSIFHEISNSPFAARYIETNAFDYLSYEDSSFWMKNKSAFNLWTNYWPSIVDNLPEVYNPIKNDILTFKNWHLPAFDKMLLLHYRSCGDFKPFDILKKYKILNKISKGHFYEIFLTSLIPAFLAKKAIKYKHKIIRKLCFLPAKIGNIIYAVFNDKYDYNRNTTVKIDRISDYEKREDCFKLTENVKSLLLFGGQDGIEPYITVFIPCYKRFELFKEALGSVLNQERADFDWNIIVVDNEPYDGKPNKIQKYIEELNNDRISYYRNEKTLNVADNFNRGILLAKAPWVMMLHDDDLLLPNSLYKMKLAIEFLCQKSGKPLGAVSASGYQFKYDPSKPDIHKKLVQKLNKNFLKKPMSYKFYKQTHLYPFFTGHIGGSAPTNGSTYNREALISIGGFNDKHGIMADLIANYCLENNYSVYLTSEPYGLYRWGANQSSEYRVSYRIVEDGYKFREYLFSKNIFTRLWGTMFREFLYRYFLETVLEMRKAVSGEYILPSDYADIYNKKPRSLIFKIWRRAVPKTYERIKYIESKILSYEAKKYFKNRSKNAADI